MSFFVWAQKSIHRKRFDPITHFEAEATGANFLFLLFEAYITAWEKTYNANHVKMQFNQDFQQED